MQQTAKPLEASLRAALANPAAGLNELDRLDAEQDHLYFTRLIYPEIEGAEFEVGPHIAVICKTLDRVISGEIKRLIINIPPGYLKTVLGVWMFIARGLAINPAAKFIHASYSDALVQENSARVRDILACEAYSTKWQRDLREDTSGKGRWLTEMGGGLLARSSGGQITGFRAGTLQPGFTGAMVLDDPLKPDDALSETARKKINNRWHTTFKSRLGDENAPVIVIMQRLHDDDFSGYLLRGGAGCKWHHLMLPVDIDNSQAYPDQFSHGVPIPHGLPDGPLWPRKHSAEKIRELKYDEYTYAAQYAQRPMIGGGAIFKEDHFRSYMDLPQLKYRKIWADTAQKDKERADYTVFQCWGAGANGKAYLLDQIRARMEAPELLKTAQAFWDKHKTATRPANGTLRAMAIEDKSSGTGLIQQLRRTAIPVQEIPRNKGQDKYSRALDVVPFFNSGMVEIPNDAPWLLDWKMEMLAFDGRGGGHDDQVDPTMDAVAEICSGSGGSWAGAL